MRKLLSVLLLCLSAFSYAEVHQADTCIACNFVSPNLTGSAVVEKSVSVLSVTGLSGTVLASSIDSNANEATNIEITGTPTGNVVIEFAVGAKIQTIENLVTTYTVSAKMTGGSATQLPPKKKIPVYANGTSFEVLDNVATVLTWANLPDPTLVPVNSARYTVSDYPGGVPQDVISNGTKFVTPSIKFSWVPEAAPRPTVSGTTETTVKAMTIGGANFLSANDNVVLGVSISKNNTTNSQTGYVRLGTTGTTADQLILSGTVAVAAQSNWVSTVLDFTVINATTIEINNGLGFSTLTTTTKRITLTEGTTNALILSFGLKNDGAGTTTQYDETQLRVTKQ